MRYLHTFNQILFGWNFISGTLTALLIFYYNWRYSHKNNIPNQIICHQNGIFFSVTNELLEFITIIFYREPIFFLRFQFLVNARSVCFHCTRKPSTKYISRIIIVFTNEREHAHMLNKFRPLIGALDQQFYFQIIAVIYHSIWSLYNESV